MRRSGSEVVGWLSAICFFTSSIWHDFLKFHFNLEFSRNAVFAAALGLAVISVALTPTETLNRLQSYRWVGLLAGYFVLASALHIALGLPLDAKNLSMYSAPVAGFLFLFNRQPFVHLLVATVVFSTLIQIHESYFQTYWYVWHDDFITHDEALYVSRAGIFRAKGLFAGPLNGYGLGLLALLLSEFSIVAIAAVSLSAALAATKSGIVASCAAILLRAFNRKKMMASLLLSSVLVVGYLGLSQAIIARFWVTHPAATTHQLDTRPRSLPDYLSIVVDPKVSSTRDRIASWEKGISDFSKFSTFHVAFGDPNFAYRVPDYMDRGVESSILKELQDYGLIGALIATTAKLLTFFALWRRSLKMAIGFAAYCAIAAVSPVYVPLGADVLLWLFMMSEVASLSDKRSRHSRIS
ncbi:hypothetical protein AC629_37625 [Bradyrhizobium sp. NAS80.1]|nr:hypothetical protein AC629_37625 [Bradyrhizobium sp. NAS80.1]